MVKCQQEVGHFELVVFGAKLTRPKLFARHAPNLKNNIFWPSWVQLVLRRSIRQRAWPLVGAKVGLDRHPNSVGCHAHILYPAPKYTAVLHLAIYVPRTWYLIWDIYFDESEVMHLRSDTSLKADTDNINLVCVFRSIIHANAEIPFAPKFPFDQKIPFDSNTNI